MEKKKATEYIGNVNGVEVKAATKKDFIFAYLTELKNQHKDKNILDRVLAYVDYFVENFKYDDKLKEDKLKVKDNPNETKCQ